MPRDLAGGGGLHARELGVGRGGHGHQGRGVRGDAHGLELGGEVVGQGLVGVLQGQGVGALEGVDLVAPVAALVGDLGQEGPALDGHVAVQGVPEAPADGVAGAPPRQLPGDGGEEPQALVGAVGLDQVAKGLLAGGQGLLGQLGHLGHGLQGPIRVSAAQLDLGEGIQQVRVPGIAGEALPQVARGGAIVALDHAEPALGQEDLGGGDHRLGALEDLAGLPVHVLHGQGLGHLEVDHGGAILHPLLVVEVRQLDLHLQVLGVEVDDLVELFQGALDEPLLLEVLGDLHVDLHGVGGLVHLAVEVRQALGRIDVLGGVADHLLEDGGSAGVEAIPLVGGAQPLVQLHALLHPPDLHAQVADLVLGVVVLRVVVDELLELLDGPLDLARRQEPVGLLLDFGAINGHSAASGCRSRVRKV